MLGEVNGSNNLGASLSTYHIVLPRALSVSSAVRRAHRAPSCGSTRSSEGFARSSTSGTSGTLGSTSAARSTTSTATTGSPAANFVLLDDVVQAHIDFVRHFRRILLESFNGEDRETVTKKKKISIIAVVLNV